MAAPALARATSHGVTLLGDPNRPGGVTLAFTERGGGVSEGCYSSLNLGDACGDDPAAVVENRRRALAAIGAKGLLDRLVNPVQVHGDRVLLVDDEGSLASVRGEAREGADAIVCTLPDVPVLLCSADCALVVVVVPGGFAVAHSGWKGTYARISAKALDVLLSATGSDACDARVYVGPHIGASDYEVSAELAGRFSRQFGPDVIVGERNLDLGRAIARTLEGSGVVAEQVAWVDESTLSNTDRYFSYRASGGTCGRVGALACMLAEGEGHGTRDPGSRECAEATGA